MDWLTSGCTGLPVALGVRSCYLHKFEVDENETPMVHRRPYLLRIVSGDIPMIESRGSRSLDEDIIYGHA